MRYLLAFCLYLLSTGALGMLFLAPRRELGDGFFRLIGWFFGGLLVLGAGLALTGQGGPDGGLWTGLLTASAVGAVVHVLALRGAALGLALLARLFTVVAGLVGATLMLAAVLEVQGALGVALVGLGAVTSAFLLGAVTTAMLCGHWYLIDRKLDYWVLRRFTGALGAAAVLKLVALATTLALLEGVSPRLQRDLLTVGALPNLAFLARAILGGLMPAALTAMAWDCALRESNQSATGLLYVTVCFVLGGEGLALVVAAMTGVLL